MNILKTYYIYFHKFPNALFTFVEFISFIYPRKSINITKPKSIAFNLFGWLSMGLFEQKQYAKSVGVS